MAYIDKGSPIIRLQGWKGHHFLVQNNFIYLFSRPSWCFNLLASMFLKHIEPTSGPLYLFSLKCSFPNILMESLSLCSSLCSESDFSYQLLFLSPALFFSWHLPLPDIIMIFHLPSVECIFPTGISTGIHLFNSLWNPQCLKQLMTHRRKPV